MRKRNRLILAMAVLAVLAITACWLLNPRPADPIYGGHRLSWWVSRSPFGSEAAEVPPGLDSNAVPYLIHCLKTRDGSVRRAYSNLYHRFPAWLQNRLPPPINVRLQRFYCCILIGTLGPAAQPAIPELICMLNPDDDRQGPGEAMFALSMIASHDNTAVVEALEAAAQNKDPRIREPMLGTLERIDPEAATKARADAAKTPPSLPHSNASAIPPP